MNADEIQFSQVSVQIRESWALAIEWYITKIEYVHLGFPDFDNPIPQTKDKDNMQDWTSISSHQYTPLFIDILDNYNQSRLRGDMPEDRCPDGGWFNGSHCYIDAAPSGESAFIYSDNFYHTPIGACNCPRPGSWFDGVNCFVMDIPDNSIGLIWNNQWYLFPAGNDNYPYDQISGYSIGTLESNIVKYAYGLTSLRTKLKANKPSGITDKHIDVYLNFFFNL